jgi:hypothetical protein
LELQFQIKTVEGGSYDDVVADETGSAASDLLSDGEGEQTDRAERILHRVTDLS